MKLSHVAAAAVAVVLLAGCDPEVLVYGLNPKVKKAEQRVQEMLEGMRLEGDRASGQAIQKSICRWYNGSAVIADRGEFEVAYEDFEKWRRKKSLFDKKLDSYSIVSSELVEGSSPATVNMTIEIDGRKLGLEVPDEEPIRWSR